MAAPRDPNLRIGDPERRVVAEALQRHFAEGRLDMAEFEERVAQVHAARVAADLQAPLHDLPPLPTDDDRQGLPVAAAPPPLPSASPDDIKGQVKRVTSMALARAEQKLAEKQRREHERALRRAERERRRLARRDSHAARQVATMTVTSLFLVGVWAATGGGYFWPIWPIMVFVFAAAMRLARRL